MRIIAIEGLDKSGKHTATTLLYEYLGLRGLSVERMSFPNYESPMGELIRQWLNGEFVAEPAVFELLQAADKQNGQAFIRQCEDRGVDVLLIDRYVHTMWAYGAYDNDKTWVQSLTPLIRLPDVVLFMDVAPEVSMNRRGKFGDNDRYESDLARLRHTRDEFKALLEEKKGSIAFHTIDANNPLCFVNKQVLRFVEFQYRDMIQSTSNDMNVI